MSIYCKGQAPGLPLLMVRSYNEGLPD